MELLRLSLVFGLMFNLNGIQPSCGQDDSALAEEYFHNFFRPGRDPGFFLRSERDPGLFLRSGLFST